MKIRMFFWIKYVRWVMAGLFILHAVLLPWISCMVSPGEFGEYEIFDRYSDYVYFILPFSSAIVNVLIQKEYVEGRVRELLLGDHTDILMTVFNSAITGLTFLSAYIVFDDSRGNVTDLLIQIFLIIFLMNGVSMAVYYTSGSSSLTILLLMAYAVLSNSYRLFEIVEELLMPWVITSIRNGGFESPYFTRFFVVGTIGWCVGIGKALSRRREV